MTTVAIFGAGGNMGNRVSNTLRKSGKYDLLFVEPGEAAQERVQGRGDTLCSEDDACARADVIVLAVADVQIGKAASSIVPKARPGAIIMTLDPAAPYAGKLPERDDITYFVTHPAHPPVFNDETTEAAKKDFFGSGIAKQSIVSALMQGPEEDFARGEEVAKDMFGPIIRSHRVTVEQMAILEPPMSETVIATLATVMREAVDHVVSLGVPREAAMDFALGHINIPLAIVFDQIEWDFSAGAKAAIADGKQQILQPDWKKVFEIENVKKSIERITGDD